MKSLKDKIQQVLENIESHEVKPTKIGGTRLRKMLSELGKECKLGRTTILENIKKIPVKKRLVKIKEDVEKKE